MNISGILQTVAFLTLFILFISGSIGWLFGYTIIAAMVISVAILLLSHKHYEIRVDEFSGITEVGGEISVTVRFKKNGFCFLPVVFVMGELPDGRFKACSSLLFRKESEAVVRFRPRSCGLNKVTFTRSYAGGFLGLFHLYRNLDMCSSVAVLPRLVEYTGPEVVPSFLPSESEEREDGAAVAYGGTAGYEHRDYMAGDSPRRINYKLSAKKHKLLVRMDESSGTESTNIVLAADADGNCAEQALALAGRLVMGGSPVSVYHQGAVFAASLPSSVDKLREWLAFRRFTGEFSGVDAAPTGNVCVIISPQGISVK